MIIIIDLLLYFEGKFQPPRVEVAVHASDSHRGDFLISNQIKEK